MKALDAAIGEIEVLRKRNALVDVEIQRMVRAIAEGHTSSAVTVAIAKREAEVESTPQGCSVLNPAPFKTI